MSNDALSIKTSNTFCFCTPFTKVVTCRSFGL